MHHILALYMNSETQNCERQFTGRSSQQHVRIHHQLAYRIPCDHFRTLTTHSHSPLIGRSQSIGVGGLWTRSKPLRAGVGTRKALVAAAWASRLIPPEALGNSSSAAAGANRDKVAIPPPMMSGKTQNAC